MIAFSVRKRKKCQGNETLKMVINMFVYFSKLSGECYGSILEYVV